MFGVCLGVQGALIPNILEKQNSVAIYKRFGLSPRDPCYGLRYNSLSDAYGVAHYIFSVDVARSPIVHKDVLEPVNVIAKAFEINKNVKLINKSNKKIMGKGYL